MPAAPFTFVRLSYHSGDWDAVDERMPANLLHSLVQYTTVPVDPKEKVVALDSPELFNYPFCYLSGHRLVQFSAQEKKNFTQYVRNGGFVFVDDCNHDIDGLFARSFEEQMRACFGATALKDGPPNTGFELNGWGDDLVHDYLKGVEINGRLGVLYSNKDYGCEWDYDFRNKRFLAEDNTKFGVNILLYALS
jgi:hypothetical protein